MKKGGGDKYVEVPLYFFHHGAYFLTAELIETTNGFVSDWWVSHLDGGEVSVAGHLTLPVYGASKAVAANRLSMVYTTVADLIAAVSGGEGSGAVYSPHARAHAEAHVKEYYNQAVQDKPSKIERTIFLYRTLSEFRIDKPAKVIAELEGGISVRTIHDRLDRARISGTLDRPGQGKSWT